MIRGSGCRRSPPIRCAGSVDYADSDVLQRFFCGDGGGRCGKGLEIAAVVDLLHYGKTWELDEVDIAQREFEEDPADGSTVQNAHLLPCCVDHTAGKARPAERQVGIP